MTGCVVAITVSTGKRRPVRRLDRARVVTAAGIEGDYRVKTPKPSRHVCIAISERVDAVAAELGVDLRPGDVRENLTVSGLADTDLEGSEIRINDVTFLVERSRHFCYRMDPLHPSARDALNRHGAAYMCSVVRGGDIAVGDAVHVMTRV